jgi:O-antigen ligase
MSTIAQRKAARAHESAARTGRSVRAPKGTIFYLTVGTLAASILLGGGTHSGFLGDAVLQLISIPLLCLALREIIKSGAYRPLKGPLAFAALLALVPATQLIPLPASIWTALPGRDVISETYRLLGQAPPAMPLTLSPSATWLSGLALLPPIAIFLGALTLTYAERRSASLVLIAFGVVSVFVGLTQLAQGPNSSWRFFKFTNRSEAVGFFANRNHFAALLYSAVVFASIWLIDATIKAGREPRRRIFESATILPLARSFIAFVALLAAQLMTRSRAGLGLTILALFAIIALATADRRASASRAGAAKLTLVSATVVIVFSLQFALYRILERFGADPLADARLPFARNTIAAAKAYMPFGSGLGTFMPVYQLFEKPTDVATTFANHAHNDLLEVWLETGVLGPVLIGVFLFWFARASLRAWRPSNVPTGELDRGLARAASIAIALLGAHSLVDYPLRTSALAAVAAFTLALLIPAVNERRNQLKTPRRDTGSSNPRRKDQHDEEQPPAPERIKRPSKPRPHEPWGQSIVWPPSWQKPEHRASSKADT